MYVNGTSLSGADGHRRIISEIKEQQQVGNCLIKFYIDFIYAKSDRDRERENRSRTGQKEAKLTAPWYCSLYQFKRPYQ